MQRLQSFPLGGAEGTSRPQAVLARALDVLADTIIAKHAPLPQRSLSELVSHLRLGVPQWADQRQAALHRLRQRLPQVQLQGQTWYWPDGESPTSRRHRSDASLRLLAPFDPVVWDRRRFEIFWGWPYRFEAYTPAPQRLRGYYALPLLRQGRIDGWGNLSLADGRLHAQIGWHDGRAPREGAWRPALELELSRCARFLGPAESAFEWRDQRR